MECTCRYACKVYVCLHCNQEKTTWQHSLLNNEANFQKDVKTFTRRSQDKLLLRSELHPVVQSGMLLPKQIKRNIALILFEYDYMVRPFWPDGIIIIIITNPSGNKINFTTDLCKDLLPRLTLSVTSRINNACKQWSQNEVVWFWQQNIPHLAKAYVSNANDFTSN